MPSMRDIVATLRVAALWLLLVPVLLGPVGLGGSAASPFASASCGVSCPCEGAEHRDDGDADGDAEHHADAHADADACDDGDAEHRDDEPCDDECPEDCPNCGCCLGAAVAVLPLPVSWHATSGIAARACATAEQAAVGACVGVFRPPRARA